MNIFANEVLKRSDPKAWRYLNAPDAETRMSKVAPALLRRFLTTPQPGKKRSQAYLEHFDTEHERLGTFWANVHELSKDYFTSTKKLPPNDVEDYFAVFAINRRQEYLEAVQKERRSIVADIKRLEAQDNT